MEHIGNDLLTNTDKYVKSVDKLLELYAKADSDGTDFSGEIAKISTAIKKNKNKQDKLLELYTEDEINKIDYLEKNTLLKAEAEKLYQQLALINEEQAHANDTGSRLARVRDFFLNLNEDESTAMEVARAMLDKIVILKSSTKTEMKIRITMNYGKAVPSTILQLGKTGEKPVIAGKTNSFTLYKNTEISPLVSTEAQSEELITYINQEMDEDPSKIWELNMFGKSMHEMVRDGLQNKLFRMPETAQLKFQDTLQRLINKDSGGLICIIL